MVRWNKAYIKNTKDIVGVDDELSSDLEFECMACGAAMIRRRGEKRVHHFAHKEKTAKCNPESYFHKLGKEIFKAIYDESLEYIVIPSGKRTDLKHEYGDCLIEDRQGKKILKQNADLCIKHKDDEDKDIIVEILFTHQVTKEKIDTGSRIIEIRLPNECTDDNVSSNIIEQKIREICTPPLRVNENIHFYNFEDGIVYEEACSSNISFANPTSNLYDDECLGTDYGRKSTPKFRNYFSYKIGSEDKSQQTSIDVASKEILKYNEKVSSNVKKEIAITGYLVTPYKEKISPTILFEVSDVVKSKYPNIRHQPAVLPNYKQAIDIIVMADNKEYWLGIDYRKREVIKDDFEKKIPSEWKEAVKEYIDDLKLIKDKSK